MPRAGLENKGPAGMIPQFFVLRKGVHAGVNGFFVYPSSCTVHIVVCHAEDMWIVRKFADSKRTLYIESTSSIMMKSTGTERS